MWLLVKKDYMEFKSAQVLFVEHIKLDFSMQARRSLKRSLATAKVKGLI